MAKDNNSVAGGIGLIDVTTDVAIDDISFDILYTMYKPNPKDHNEQLAEFKEFVAKQNLPEAKAKKMLADLSEYTEERMNAKVKALYKEWTGVEWSDTSDKVKSTLLLGSPGQGKTTSFKQAARRVSAGLGLNFKLNPGDEVTIYPNDFMFVSMEFSGENQVTTVGGIPAKTVDESTGIEYMTKLVNKRLAMARSAGGALVLLDDFPNASPNVQNVGLSLTDEKRFQGLNLDNVYIGLTGNLGSLDGTHTTRLSTALRGRCKIMFTQDNLDNWVTRTQQTFRDGLSDVGLCGFLKREPQFFAEMPNTRQQGGFPSPRSWDAALTEIRRAVAEKGGRGKGEIQALTKITRIAQSFLGLEVGLKLQAYFHSMMMGADPIARQMIHEGTFNKKAFEEKFKDGYSAESQHFAYQFGVALADYAVQSLVDSGNRVPDASKNKNLRQVMERFATGVNAVNEDTFAFTIDHFKAKLANQVEEWATAMETRRVLTTEVKKEMAKVIAECKDFTEEKRKVMIDALSDADKYNLGSKRRR